MNQPMQATVQFGLNTQGVYTDSVKNVSGIVPFEKSLAAFSRTVQVLNGSISEWLPAWGTQVFRFNGTSSCAVSVPKLDLSNLVLNPSFESSVSYIAAPDSWDCAVTNQLDRACFADSSTSIAGRRSGRFTTGFNSGSLRIV